MKHGFIVKIYKP